MVGSIRHSGCVLLVAVRYRSRPARLACHCSPLATSRAVNQPSRTQWVSIITRNPPSNTSPSCRHSPGRPWPLYRLAGTGVRFCQIVIASAPGGGSLK